MRSPRKATQERRQQIIAATQRCLLRDGYQATSMDNIVKEAGLSKGTLYWHFKNKKDLFLALFEEILRVAVSAFTPLLQQDLPPDQKIRLLFSSLSLLREENSALITLPLSLMTDLLIDDDFICRYREIITDLAIETQKIIEQGVELGIFRKVDAAETAWALMTMYDGELLYSLFSMPLDIHKQSQILSDLVLNGLFNHSHYLDQKKRL